MQWLKDDEIRDVELICKIMERMRIYAHRTYDNETLLGAAPIFMANDARVFRHDMRYLHMVLENLMTKLDKEE